MVVVVGESHGAVVCLAQLPGGDKDQAHYQQDGWYLADTAAP